MSPIDDGTLVNLERQYASGLTSGDLIDVCASHGIQLSEATLRKYVQLGLLPRSVRVGRKVLYRKDAVRDWLCEQEARKTGAHRAVAARR